MERLLCIVIGYVFGMIQTGYFYGKMRKIDIREHGSGNAGTTNTLRTLGWKAGAITFLGDCLKCVAAVVVARAIFGGSEIPGILLGLYAGFGAVLGHNYPFYLKFKGGKGIACMAGVIITLHPVFVAISLVVFASVVLITRYVSVGSLVLMVAFVAQVVVYGQMGGFGLSGMNLYEFYGISIFLAVLAFVRHRKNIVRLLQGTENKFGVKKEENV